MGVEYTDLDLSCIPVPGKKKSLRKAVKQLREMIEGTGGQCPCCKQVCRAYKRALNSQQARTLIWMYKHTKGKKRWITIAEEAPRWVVASPQLATVAHWGLVKGMPTKEGNRGSGIWRLSDKGVRFVERKLKVRSHVVLYNNEIVGWSTKKVKIDECLAKGFIYSEIING